MKRILNFDMDGTIADFYGVEGWLESIENSDTYPYDAAKGKLNLSQLAKLLNRLSDYEINIISWTAKDGSPAYNKAVEAAKKKWLNRHLPSVHFAHIYIVDYGTPKHEISKGILFDDNEEIRNDWGEGAFDETEILKVLKGLI